MAPPSSKIVFPQGSGMTRSASSNTAFTNYDMLVSILRTLGTIADTVHGSKSTWSSGPGKVEPKLFCKKIIERANSMSRRLDAAVERSGAILFREKGNIPLSECREQLKKDLLNPIKCPIEDKHGAPIVLNPYYDELGRLLDRIDEALDKWLKEARGQSKADDDEPGALLDRKTPSTSRSCAVM